MSLTPHTPQAFILVFHTMCVKFPPGWLYYYLPVKHHSYIYIYIYIYIYFKGRLKNALKTLVYELFLKTFYKENDKIINVVDSFLYLS